MQSNEIKISYFKHPIYDDYASDENGNIYSLKSGEVKIINPYETKGYLRFSICYNEKVKKYYVHRFIYECCNNFIIRKGFEIDHLDRNKKNNQITNLRLVSKSTNLLNRFSNEEVEELPGDAIKIIMYNSHLFENIYLSPSKNCIYKSSESYFFRIPFKSYNGCYYVRINDINKKRVHISLNKLRKNLGF